MVEVAEPSLVIQVFMQRYQQEPYLFFNPSWKAGEETQLIRASGIISRSIPDNRPRDPAAARIHDNHDRFSRYFAVASSKLIAAVQDNDFDEFEVGDRESGEAIQNLEAPKALQERLCGG